jgi:hypothetical protein
MHDWLATAAEQSYYEVSNGLSRHKTIKPTSHNKPKHPAVQRRTSYQSYNDLNLKVANTRLKLLSKMNENVGSKTKVPAAAASSTSSNTNIYYKANADQLDEVGGELTGVEFNDLQDDYYYNGAYNKYMGNFEDEVAAEMMLTNNSLTNLDYGRLESHPLTHSLSFFSLFNKLTLS